jgi:magnesium transporter
MADSTTSVYSPSAQSGVRPPVGAVPGHIVEHEYRQPTKLRVMTFTSDSVKEHDNPAVDDIPALIQQPGVTWIDISGFQDVALIRKLAELLELHPLLVADAVNTKQRSKTENYPDYTFVVLHSPALEDDWFYSEQVALVFNDRFVLTFQELERTDPFKALRERILAARGLVRSKGNAYLAYALLDLVTDHYFPVIDVLNERLETVEERILEGDLKIVEQLYGLRHLCADAARRIKGNRDALATLLRQEAPYITGDFQTYLRDAHDHAMHQDEAVKDAYDFAISLRELHSTSQNARLNEIIKVLTLVSTVFIPLGFFAGIYGMNFDPDLPGNMPELNTPYAYWIWWSCMVAVVFGMLMFFRHKGWIGNRPRR